MFDNQGLTVTVSDRIALEFYNSAVIQWLEYKISAMKTLKQAIEIDNDFCMAHCFRGYLFMTFNSAAVLPAAQSALAKAVLFKDKLSQREQCHIRALSHLIAGAPNKACACWDEIVATYPHDIVALRMHHYTCFWSGYRHGLSATPAAVLPSWNDSIPHYGNVLGMVAFGLEELGLYAQAESYGRKAAEQNINDLWAIHAVAHVMEMQQRAVDGLEWLNYQLDDFKSFNPFRGHIWWHKGLFLIEAGLIDEALSLYDSAIYDTESEFFLDIQNSVSFLARLEFKGVNVEDRWQKLVNFAKCNSDGHSLVFTDLHHIIALCRAKKFEDANAHILSMEDFANNRECHTASVIRTVGIPIGRSILAHEKGDYEKALDLMMSHRLLMPQLGASNAQRDLLALLCINMAQRAKAGALHYQLLQEREFGRKLARL